MMDWIAERFEEGGWWMFAISGVAFTAAALFSHGFIRMARVSPGRSVNQGRAPWGIFQLGNLGSLAMLLGCLGTISGMLRAFSRGGCCFCDLNEKMEFLARDFSETMTSAAYGLAVALLVLILQAILHERWARRRDPGSYCNSPAPKAYPVRPSSCLLASAACLFPMLIGFLFMGASLQPHIHSLPVSFVRCRCACLAQADRARPTLAVTPSGYHLEMTDGWRVDLPGSAHGLALVEESLETERTSDTGSQRQTALKIQVDDRTTLEEIVAVMDVCRSQGYTQLQLAALD